MQYCVGLQIHNHLNWKNNSDQVIFKSSGVWYAVPSMFRSGNIESFKTIHFAYYNSVIKYRKIILHNWAHSNNTFTLKKLLEFWSVQNLEIHLEACLKRLQCFPLPGKYTLSSMNLILTEKKNNFKEFIRTQN
jgi:hypothetical protein